VNREALRALVAEGGAKAAEKLGEATGEKWVIESVALSVEDDAVFEPLLAGIAKDHYGSHFSIPGAGIVVMFPGKSGYLVSTAFTRDHQDQVESMDKRELKSLAEIANIFLNPLIGHLAAAWRRTVILSAPKMEVASQRDLVTAALARFQDKEKLAASLLIKLSSPNLFSQCAVAIFLDSSLADLAG